MTLSGWAKTRELLYSEHLEVIPIAYPGIWTASILEKLEIGVYFGYPKG